MNNEKNKLKFTKMQGCGNDYIYIDCFEGEPDNIGELSIKLSDRHFGIGGDGIVLICPSQSADAKMRMFNADGSEGKMCGNAIRCVGKYLYDIRKVEKNSLTIETLSGIKSLWLEVKDGVAVSATVDMGKAILCPEKIPVRLEGERIINRKVYIGKNDTSINCVSMGNPHCVIFGEDPSTLELEKIGPVFENADIFPDRVNSEFVHVINETTLKMRVWERGSGETLACGTGACASVVAAVENGYCRHNTDINVYLTGGCLTVRYADDKSVYMSGPASIVFTGEIEI